MKTAHIAGLAGNEATAVIAPVLAALQADGWQVVTASTAGSFATPAEIQLAIVVAANDEAFVRHAAAFQHRARTSECPALLVRIALRPDATPSSLPTLVGPVSSHDAIRHAALALAPSIRVNAITADPDAVDPAILGREIAVALALLIGSPAMTGVTMPLDRTAIARYAAASPQKEEPSPS